MITIPLIQGHRPALDGLAHSIILMPWLAPRWLTVFYAGVTLTLLLAQTPIQATSSKPLENSLGMQFRKVPGEPVWFSIWETRVRDYRRPPTLHPPLWNGSSIWMELKAMIKTLAEKGKGIKP